MMMHNRSYPPSKWLTAYLLMLAGLAFWGFGCGQKGSPRPPQRPLPPAVKDLSLTVHNDRVELNWSISGADSRTESLPAAVRVLRAKLKADESICDTCPIRFTEIGEVPTHMKSSEKARPTRMSFTEILEPGYRYIYKVVVYDEDGMYSKDSNFVKLDH
jgi:hypothetical protein